MDETWMPMFNPETKRQSAQWKHTDSPLPKKFRLTASAEKMMVAMFWDSEGVILVAFPRVQQWRVRLWRSVMNEVSSSIAWKAAQKGFSCVLSSRQRPSSSGGSCSPVFRRQQLWSCSSCSVLTWLRTKRFLAVSNTEGHPSWSHIFKSFRSCNSDFPVVATNP